MIAKIRKKCDIHLFFLLLLYIHLSSRKKDESERNDIDNLELRTNGHRPKGDNFDLRLAVFRTRRVDENSVRIISRIERNAVRRPKGKSIFRLAPLRFLEHESNESNETQFDGRRESQSLGLRPCDF